MDREKVIKELDKLVDEVNPWKESPPLRCDIPYPLLCDALSLLKEQEAVEPIPYHRSDGTIFKYECRKCRTKIFKMDLFCRHCGQAVKWDG